MKKFYLILFLAGAGLQSVLAARPTVHASNFTASMITCNSLQLNWTYGDGAARIIVAREGAAPDWTPSDNTTYSANPSFGKGTAMNGTNYILYNAGGTNFVKIDSLKTGKTYYFVIYEHDNAGSSTLYYTSNSPPQINVTMFEIKLDFSVLAIDSCEQKNLFRFTNNSSSTISPITYTFYFGDGTTSTGSPVNKSYQNVSGQVSVRLNASPNLGCPSDISKTIKIYPKKVAYIDYNSFEDTQCLNGNYFEVDPQALISPLPKSFTYNWKYGDGTTATFKKMRKSYQKSGSFNVEVEVVINVKLEPTACKDTLRFNVVVLPSPIGSASINDTVQCLTNNKFIFSNTDPSLTYFKWYYGDNDSSGQRTFSHSYTKVGKDTIIHEAHAVTGCKGRDTVVVEVLPDLNSDFTGLNTQYCSSSTTVTLNPITPGGVFEKFPLDANNAFQPLQIGKHQISYIVSSQYCKDTTTKDFEIFRTPEPDLGPDIAVCDEGARILNANDVPGNYTYLWNTSETTSSIFVNFTGKYWVRTTEGNCSGSDTADVVYSTIPVVELGKDTSVCKGNGLILNVSNPKSTYLWNDGSTDSIYTVYEPGKYTVSVSNPCGQATDSLFVFFQTDYCDLFMANAFSPDNDLINNVFMPVGKNITVELFQIYNRWGQMVFETDKNAVGWDGTYMGLQSPQDLYIWKLFYTTPSGKYIKKSNATGTVLLIR